MLKRGGGGGISASGRLGGPDSHSSGEGRCRNLVACVLKGSKSEVEGRAFTLIMGVGLAAHGIFGWTWVGIILGGFCCVASLGGRGGGYTRSCCFRERPVFSDYIGGFCLD